LAVFFDPDLGKWGVFVPVARRFLPLSDGVPEYFHVARDFVLWGDGPGKQPRKLHVYSPATGTIPLGAVDQVHVTDDLVAYLVRVEATGRLEVLQLSVFSPLRGNKQLARGDDLEVKVDRGVVAYYGFVHSGGGRDIEFSAYFPGTDHRERLANFNIEYFVVAQRMVAWTAFHGGVHWYQEGYQQSRKAGSGYEEVEPDQGGRRFRVSGPSRVGYVTGPDSRS
jgi:hypothetical protein